MFLTHYNFTLFPLYFPLYPFKSNPRLLSSAGILTTTSRLLFTLFHPHFNPGGSAGIYKKRPRFFLQAVILNRLLVFAIGQVIGGNIALPAAVCG